MNKNSQIKLVILTLVIPMLMTPVITSQTTQYRFELDVDPLIQYDLGAGVCQHTSEAMLLIYLDHTYGTNYFGQPTNPNLVKYYGDHIQEIVFDYIDAHPNPGVVTNIEAWAWYRNQPTYDYVTNYKDWEYNIEYKGYEKANSFCEYEIVYVNVTNELIRDTLVDTNCPVKFSVTGHSSIIFGYEDNDLLVYDTWYYTPRHLNQDNMHPSHWWYIKSFYVYHFPFMDEVTPDEDVPGDMNGDGQLNAADIHYLGMHLVDDPQFQNPQQPTDINSDGFSNAADVAYLACHLLEVPGYETLYP